MSRTTVKYSQLSRRQVLVLQNGKTKRVSARFGGNGKHDHVELYQAEINHKSPPRSDHRAAIEEGLRDFQGTYCLTVKSTSTSSVKNEIERVVSAFEVNQVAANLSLEEGEYSTKSSAYGGTCIQLNSKIVKFKTTVVVLDGKIAGASCG